MEKGEYLKWNDKRNTQLINTRNAWQAQILSTFQFHLMESYALSLPFLLEMFIILTPKRQKSEDNIRQKLFHHLTFLFNFVVFLQIAQGYPTFLYLFRIFLSNTETFSHSLINILNDLRRLRLLISAWSLIFKKKKILDALSW